MYGLTGHSTNCGSSATMRVCCAGGGKFVKQISFLIFRTVPLPSASQRRDESYQPQKSVHTKYIEPAPLHIVFNNIFT